MGFPVVGIVGGGQLARMTYTAAIPLGVRVRLLAAARDESAAQVVPDVVLGDPGDLAALRAFAAGCDVLTFDHEGVPAAHLAELERAGVVVRPGPAALAHTQDKGVLGDRLAELGLPAPRWRRVADAGEVAGFAAEAGGWPVVVKAVSGGYDGRGVWVVDGPAAAGEVVERARARGVPLLVEERVRFRRELSALVARSPSGQAAAYPVVQTVQVEGICREVIAPAPGSGVSDEETALAAQELALGIAAALDVTGVLAVELFDTDGTGEGLLVNELAMRPHNSGHWTIEGAVTSQFEQHLRAVLDLPLGDPRPRAPHAVMANVLGGDHPDLYPAYLHVMARDPGARVHLYGKQVRVGRKVGHVTVAGADVEDLLERARHAAGYLAGEILE